MWAGANGVVWCGQQREQCPGGPTQQREDATTHIMRQGSVREGPSDPPGISLKLPRTRLVGMGGFALG